MNAKTFQTAAVSMIAGAALATAGIVAGVKLSKPAHAAEAQRPTAVIVAPHLKHNARLLRYHRSQPGRVTLAASIESHESGWSVQSTCAGKAVVRGTDCWIGASYDGKASGLHQALIDVHITDDAGHVSERMQQVTVYVDRKGGLGV